MGIVSGIMLLLLEGKAGDIDCFLRYHRGKNTVITMTMQAQLQ